MKQPKKEHIIRRLLWEARPIWKWLLLAALLCIGVIVCGVLGPKLLGGIGRLAEQNFPRGAQVKLINGILAALGGQVKGVQGIDLITPKFHTNRHFLVGSKNIHNIAAHRELAGAIHLGPAGVAGTKQSGQQVIPQQSIPRMEGAGVGAEILFWGGELGQGFRGHSHGA